MKRGAHTRASGWGFRGEPPHHTRSHGPPIGINCAMGRMHADFHLDEVDMSHNLLTGTIPAFLMKGSMLMLDISSNQLTGVGMRACVHACLHARVVCVCMCACVHACGCLCMRACMLALMFLPLSFPRYVPPGSLPPLGKILNLLSLRLDHNRLSGALPRRLGVNRVSEIDLHSNLFAGTVPEDFVTALSIISIDLSENLYLE
jgi:hypothetical protein